MKRWVLVLLLISSTVIADKAGLVVQFDNSTVIKKCIEFQSNASAFDVLMNSGLQVVTNDYGPGLGMALCKIRDVGCSADNCFCQSQYWGFYYATGGSWEYAPVGISGYNVNNGDVLGFRWGAYGDTPELHSFSEICSSSTSQGGGGIPTRYFAIAVDGNCSKKPFMINVKEKMGGTIWEPTAFILSGNLGDIRSENGVGVKVLLHQTYSGKDTGFEKIAMLFTDKEGNTSFIPEKPGRYRLEFGREGFLGEEREIEINECTETPAVNKSVEEFKSENREVEPNITRVDIISPPTAMVNSTVVLRLVSEAGKPLAYESIVVEFSGGRKELVTNDSGEAAFSAGREGVYSYSSPNHTLSAYRVTNVIEPTKIEFKNELMPPVIRIEETASSVGMAVANPLQNTLLALVGGVIALVLLFAIRKARK